MSQRTHHDQSGLKRLLHYCARPVFALEQLRQIALEHLVSESVQPDPGGSVSLLLTPLDPIEHLAALPPPFRGEFDQRVAWQR